MSAGAALSLGWCRWLPAVFGDASWVWPAPPAYQLCLCLPTFFFTPCSQAALLRTSKAWAAVGTRCSPLEIAVGFTDGACWPLGKRSIAIQPHAALHGLPAAAAWLAQQRRLVVSLQLQLDAAFSRWSSGQWCLTKCLPLLPSQAVQHVSRSCCGCG